jgi:hypothetical protein
MEDPARCIQALLRFLEPSGGEQDPSHLGGHISDRAPTRPPERR